ncbi:histone H2A-Bbd type 1-like [Ctenodactylus gundi]
MGGSKSRRNTSRARRQSVSRSARAELQFPVSRVERGLREGQYAPRLGAATPVFLAGVLEYLTANILELAGQEAHGRRRRRIAPEHLQTALGSDAQLCRLLEEGGQPPRDRRSPRGE